MMSSKLSPSIDSAFHLDYQKELQVCYKNQESSAKLVVKLELASNYC